MSQTKDEKSQSGESTDRKEQKRLEIINAALTVFARDGFAGAKMEDVASEAGVGKGTVYLYASSKDALFRDVIRQTVLPLVQEVETLRIGYTGSAIELLRRQIRRFYADVLNEDRRKVFRLLMSEAIHFPELRQFYFETVVLRAQAAIKDTLRMGIASGEFRDIELNALPQTIFGGILAAGLWSNFLSPGASFDVDLYCEVHLDIVLNGLCAPE